MRPTLKNCLLSLLGSAILAFGLYHVHSFSGVTEGGILGLTLLMQYWLDISPAVSGLILNLACYAFGWRYLGNLFIFYSLLAGGGFSVFYAFIERFPPLWPSLAAHPLLAGIIGAVFVGVGVGLSVRAGGAPGGDDALAMSLGQIFRQPIERIYLISDLTVLVLSMSYLPAKNLACSLLSVILSGQLVGVVQRAGKKTP